MALFKFFALRFLRPASETSCEVTSELKISLQNIVKLIISFWISVSNSLCRNGISKYGNANLLKKKKKKIEFFF